MGEETTAVLHIIDETLGLRSQAMSWSAQSPLLGAVPELDSMAVVSLLTALAEHFQIELDDDIDGSVFETVGSLVAFVVSRKPAG